jgi:RNA polymerase sigma factor for flagellar operon FliA
MSTNVAKDRRIIDIDELRLAAGRREELIVKYAPLVKRVADRMSIKASSAISKQELISAGIMGLIDALDKFDGTRGTKFESYAWCRIKGAMLDEMRNRDWVPRSVRKEIRRIEDAVTALNAKLVREPDDAEIARELGVDIDSYYEMLNRSHGVKLLSLDLINTSVAASGFFHEETGEPSAFDAAMVKEMKAVIAKALSSLTNNEQLVIALYYYEELTFKEIGKILGVTESRISQIHSKALIHLRVRLKSYHKEITPISAGKGKRTTRLKDHVFSENHPVSPAVFKRRLWN